MSPIVVGVIQVPRIGELLLFISELIGTSRADANKIYGALKKAGASTALAPIPFLFARRPHTHVAAVRILVSTKELRGAKNIGLEVWESVRVFETDRDPTPANVEPTRKDYSLFGPRFFVQPKVETRILYSTELSL